EAQLTFEDQAGIAFGTGHSDALAIFQQIGSVAATDNCWDTQLAGDDRRVAGTAAAVGDDGAGALHYRFPVRIGHVRYQHVTRLDPVHFRNVTNDFHRAGTDTLTNGATFDQHGAFFLQQVAFHDIGAAAAFDCFRTCLNDVQLTVVTVLGPLDVHRAAIVLFDDHRLASQVADLLVGETEAHTRGLVDFYGLDRLAGAGFRAVNHLDCLAAQVAAQDGWPAGFKSVLVNVEFVRVHRALYDSLAQAVGAGDEHHVAETGLGIQGKHHTGGACFRANHALDTSGQSDQLVIEALVHAVGNGAVVEEGGENLFGSANHVVHATNIEEGFLLAGKGSVRQVFSGCRRTYCYRQVVIAGRHFGKGCANIGVQLRRELGGHDPAADLRTGLGQGVDIIYIQRVEHCMNLLVQAAELHEITIGLRSSGETTRY